MQDKQQTDCAGELQLASTATMAGEEGPDGKPLTGQQVQEKLRTVQEVRIRFPHADPHTLAMIAAHMGFFPPKNMEAQSDSAPTMLRLNGT